jgi:hypothetical protein
MAVTTIDLVEGVWIKLEGIDGSFTIRNRSGHPVSIVLSDVDEVPTDAGLAELGINPMEIGGHIFEVSTSEAYPFAFAKAGDSQASITIRPFGSIDPSEDITYLSQLLDAIVVTVNDHLANRNDPHDVTKEQVGLSDIPNSISDDPETNDGQTLATTALTHLILEVLTTHIQTVEGNPHGVTKADVGLSNVENYSPATVETGSDQTRDDLYMTPKATYDAVRAWIPVNMAMSPQSIIKCKMGPRPSGWSNIDCTQPSIPVEKVNDTRLIVNSGLMVAFADLGKVRESFELTQAVELVLPNNVADGMYYVYGNLTDKAAFADFAISNVGYKEAPYRDGHYGDFFDTAKCVMYDQDNNTIRRVYLAKVIVIGGIIAQIICVPLGNTVTIPATIPLMLGGRDLYYNPFMSPVTTQVEVEYNSTWGEPGWNDQIGVAARPHQTGPEERIILQAGLMGFLACGRESGSAFGANFQTVTTPIRARIVVKKK